MASGAPSRQLTGAKVVQVFRDLEGEHFSMGWEMYPLVICYITIELALEIETFPIQKGEFP